MATKKAVATKANDQMPAFLQKVDSNDTRGNEGVGADDLTIPRIELCQALSKCRQKKDPAYIQGIEEGQFYNNITRQVYGEEIVVVPIVFMKEFLLWRDQDEGGGFGGAYPNMVEAQAALDGQDDPDNWESVPTSQQFVLVLASNGTVEEAVISMAKSKNRVSKDWNSLVRINGGPRFSRRYKLRGVEAQNQQGKDFHNMAVENFGFVDESTYKAGETAYQSIMSGALTIDRTIDGESSIEDGEVSEM
tara:strand:+ start:13827 stop:14570 length:744 start_codon:yes stop_codon:yes gene_type:complete